MTKNSKRNYTVLYLDHTAKWSGGEIALLRMLQEIDRTRVTPVVVLAEDGPLVAQLEAAKIETHILPLSEKAREIRKDTLGGAALFKYAGQGMQFVNYAWQVAAFAKKRGADIFHCNSLKSDIYGAIAGKRAGIPTIWHIRDHIDPSYLPGPAVKALRAMAKTVPSYVVTNSQSTLEKLFPEGQGKQKARVLHDGLALAELDALPPDPAPEWNHKPPRIGLIGRVVAWKGQHIFLEAAAQLKKAGVSARYIVVGAAMFGEQEYEDSLRKIVADNGLESDVEFTGFQRDIPGILRSLDILVHASITPEPFGQVVIEGMAEGLPVIGTDGGGVREIVNPGVDGLLVPMNDATGLAKAMETLLRDPAKAKRIAMAGYSRVREAFTAAHTARKIEQVYAEMLGDVATTEVTEG